LYRGADEELAGVVLREAFATIGTDNVAMRRVSGVSADEADHVAVGQPVAHVAEHRGLYQAWLAASPSFHAEALDALTAQVRRVITLAAGSPRDVPAETERTTRDKRRSNA
jgi:hypothetical protein